MASDYLKFHEKGRIGNTLTSPDDWEFKFLKCWEFRVTRPVSFVVRCRHILFARPGSSRWNLSEQIFRLYVLTFLSKQAPESGGCADWTTAVRDEWADRANMISLRYVQKWVKSVTAKHFCFKTETIREVCSWIGWQGWLKLWIIHSLTYQTQF